MHGWYTVLLFIGSNIFMTLAWYGHLKLQQMHISDNWPLIAVIAFSWVIAFVEYCMLVPANRIGFEGNGGPFSLVQLKVIQEVISLIIFAVIVNMLFQGQHLHWNHIAAFVCLIAAVYLVFMK
ncbi:MAG: DMT family protein [Bacteroidaceae bacterium]|nr:DMT family protein [Bacteroidaceae bacterium]